MKEAVRIHVTSRRALFSGVQTRVSGSAVGFDHVLNGAVDIGFFVPANRFFKTEEQSWQRTFKTQKPGSSGCSGILLPGNRQNTPFTGYHVSGYKSSGFPAASPKHSCMSLKNRTIWPVFFCFLQKVPMPEPGETSVVLTKYTKFLYQICEKQML